MPGLFRTNVAEIISFILMGQAQRCNNPKAFELKMSPVELRQALAFKMRTTIIPMHLCLLPSRLEYRMP